MTPRTVRVLRLDTPMDADTFDARIAAADGLQLQVFPVDVDLQATWEAFGQAHVYHIASARDELPLRWFAGGELLERSPNLLAVSTYGAGYDTVDVEACTRAGLCVMNQAGSNAAAVAEHTIGLVLALMKRFGDTDRRLRRGERPTRVEAMGRDAEGAVLGLVGLGHAGTRVARLGQALGMHVIAYDPYLEPAQVRERGAHPASLQELLRSSDVVSLHCPLTQETRGMFDAAAFAAMKPGALFITTARGNIHDEAALHEALVSGHLGGAGLDVWSVEPPALDHPLLTLDHVLATPHTAGVTPGARLKMATMAAQQIIGLAGGGCPPRLVNPEVWPAFTRRFEHVLGRTCRPCADDGIVRKT